MADVHSKAVRSYNMSRIRGKDTKPELLVRKFLFSKGFRFRVNDRRLPGKPDIVLPKYNTAIFVHGCFWHGHDSCKFFSIPKTRSDWWSRKIFSNQLRDQLGEKELRRLGWNILTIFECELQNVDVFKKLLDVKAKLKTIKI